MEDVLGRQVKYKWGKLKNIGQRNSLPLYDSHPPQFCFTHLCVCERERSLVCAQMLKVTWAGLMKLTIPLMRNLPLPTCNNVMWPRM